MNTLLEINNVEISYSNEPKVHDINLTVNPGEILGIVGESGSGKSTLIKAVMGLLGNEGEVTNGDIFYKGKSVINIDSEKLRRLRGPEMGIVFQNSAASLCPVRKIGEQLFEMIREHQNKDKKEVFETAISFFSKMNLSDGKRILNSYPFELSGGMIQRVGISIAMMLKPDLLFADEPTSALDVITQAQIVKEMKSTREELGTAIVFVTHNIGLVYHMADNIAVMSKGHIVEYNSKEEIIHNPKQNYTCKLIQSIPKIRRI